jgi:hypothetical protein
MSLDDRIESLQALLEPFYVMAREITNQLDEPSQTSRSEYCNNRDKFLDETSEISLFISEQFTQKQRISNSDVKMLIEMFNSQAEMVKTQIEKKEDLFQM